VRVAPRLARSDQADVPNGFSKRLVVAALYIDPRGPYPSIPGVDCWDEDRDARRYRGPHPIVAHPPCGPWGRFRNLASGHDRELAPIAIQQVRVHGGVLEHPAHSMLWRYLRLPLPGEMLDSYGGFTLHVDQCAWGHVARKATWLYVVGVDRGMAAAGIRDGGTPTHVIERTRRDGARHTGLRLCSHQQRRRTPPAFAAWLVDLARTACP
jgi:hypothetical protein